MTPLKIIYMGTPDIAGPSLEACVAAGHEVMLAITQPDRPAGRGRKLRRQPVAAVADAHGVEVVQPEKISEVEGRLAELAPDLLVVLAYGQILPESVLDIPRLGAVNVHFSLLPALRGASPINRAILEGHPTTGVSTMYMDAGLDTGDVILKKETPIGQQETAGELADRLAHLGAEAMAETLQLIAEGNAPRTPQNKDQATWAPLMKKAEGELDFAKPAEVLERQVRGLDPWPGAYTSLKGKALKVFAPTRIREVEHDYEPGTVIPCHEGTDEYLYVACGENALGLGTVQAAGKRRMSARDFLCGAGDCSWLVLGQ